MASGRLPVESDARGGQAAPLARPCRCGWDRHAGSASAVDEGGLRAADTTEWGRTPSAGNWWRLCSAVVAEGCGRCHRVARRRRGSRSVRVGTGGEVDVEGQAAACANAELGERFGPSDRGAASREGAARPPAAAAHAGVELEHVDCCAQLHAADDQLHATDDQLRATDDRSITSIAGTADHDQDRRQVSARTPRAAGEPGATERLAARHWGRASACGAVAERCEPADGARERSGGVDHRRSRAAKRATIVVRGRTRE